MHSCLAVAATAGKTKGKRKDAPFAKATGFDKLQSVYEVDQSPIGRTPRSNPATYTGLFGYVRDLYSN